MPQKFTHKTAVSGIETRFYSRILLILIIAAAVFAAYLLFPRSGESKTAQSPAASNDLVLNVIPLQAQDVMVSSRYIGYVTPVNSVNVTPNISGYLEEIWVKGGQTVKAGDNLVLIRPDEYKARLEAAKAAVTQARADFNNANVYFERIRRAGAKAISKTEVDNARAKFLSAKGALAQAQAEQVLAQVNYDYTLLQAPIDGIVGNVDLTRGNYVSPASQPLFKIIQFDPIRVVFSITDKEYLSETARHPDRKLFAGENIRLRLADGTIYPFSGEYKYSGNEIDRATSSISIYADFKNPSRALVANAYVDVILERHVKDAVLIRQNYVTLTPDGSYIYTVKGKSLLKTPLDIIATQDNNYVVANNFAPGEYLVVDKVGTISKNTSVKINVLKPNAPQKQKDEK